MVKASNGSVDPTRQYGIDFRVWDIGKGSAMYLDASDVQDVVFDLGSDEFSPMDLIASSRYGIRQIDLLCLTHPHHDHISDIARMVEHGLKPRLLYRPEEVRPLVDEKIDKARREGDERYVNDASHYTDLDDEYNHEPDEDPSNETWARRVTVTPYAVTNDLFDGPRYRQMNNASPIIVVERNGFNIVVTGDNMEKNLEAAMANPELRKDIRKAQVLIAPHHGRESSYDGTFVSHVDPDLVVFSDEKDAGNSHDMYYQLPSGLPVLNEISGDLDTGQNGEGRKVLTTRQDGRIRIQANEKEDYVISYRPDYAESKVTSRKSYQMAHDA